VVDGPVGPVGELLDALELIADEKHRVNRTLEMIALEKKSPKSPQALPQKRKTG